MATCGSCGAQSTRIRSRWKDSIQLPDECPFCAPQTFEKHTDPSVKKIWIGPEYNPNAYEKRYDEDGIYYQAKPEFTAEQEAKACLSSEEREAIERKRKTRRTEPLKPESAEYERALNKACHVAHAFHEA